MNDIGQKIKELRKKNGFTQEELAGSLGVTFQSVSKWETGATTPDLGLIVPLAQILNVSTDELLGMHSDRDMRDKRKYADAYKKYKGSDEHGESYWWAKEAVLAYPENYQYIEWLAGAEYQLAYDENNSPDGSIEHLNELTDNALRRYESIIDSCSDVELIRQAIIGKIIVLVFVGRTDEAEWSAEFEYPDISVKTADEVLKMSCVGRELLALMEKEKITKD